MKREREIMEWGKAEESELKVLHALEYLKITKYVRTGSYLARNLRTPARNLTHLLLIPVL